MEAITEIKVKKSRKERKMKAKLNDMTTGSGEVGVPLMVIMISQMTAEAVIAVLMIAVPMIAVPMIAVHVVNK